MFEEDHSVPQVQKSNGLRNFLIVLAVLYVAASSYFIFELRGRLEQMDTAQRTASEENATQMASVMKRLGLTESTLKASTETLQNKLGVTQREIASRAATLQQQQQAAETRLRDESTQQITAVHGEIGGVKTDLGAAKTDIASTRTDLEATKSKLEKTMGDLGVQSGLIAHTRDDLEVLKHRGDRNYYEFTLNKGNKPTPISTVSLQLKKVDAKKGRFTLNVLADDRTIEKKDRTVSEPMQFYTGRDRNLYEIVVFNADKNKVTGYLSTPKNAPTPAVANN